MNYLYQYDSVGDYLEQCGKDKSHCEGKDGYRASVSGREGFTGTKNLEEAIKLVQNGWGNRPDISKMSREIELQGSVDTNSLSLENQITGAYVDIGAFLEGIPENMVQFVDEPIPKIVTIAFQLSTGSSMTQKAFSNRGAVILALTDKLTCAGYDVCIKAVCCHRARRNGGRKLYYGTTAITIKQPNETLDVDSLTFWACHPSALRRVHFMHCETMDIPTCELFGYGNHGGGGYGNVGDIESHKEANEAIGADVLVQLKTERFEVAVSKYEEIIKDLTDKLAS